MKVLLVAMLAFITDMLVSAERIMMSIARRDTIFEDLLYMLILGSLLAILQAMTIYILFFADSPFDLHDLATIAIGVVVGVSLAEVTKIVLK